MTFDGQATRPRWSARAGRTGWRIGLIVGIALLPTRAHGQASQVKDIYPGAFGSSPSSLTNVNGTLFFNARGDPTGRELWRSDGTAAGTVLVKDIKPGFLYDSDPSYLTNVNGTLFFAADDGSTGTELWKSDGTAAGTVQVKDINPTVRAVDRGRSTRPRGVKPA